MTQTTLERSTDTAEQQGDLHLDLGAMSKFENLPDNARIFVEVTENTADNPHVTYVVSLKNEQQNVESVKKSKLTVNENRQVEWQVNTDPDAIGFVYVRTGEEPEILGVKDRTNRGTFALEPGGSVYMMLNQSIGEHLESDLFTAKGLEATVADPDLGAETIQLSFDSAFVEAATSTDKATSNKDKAAMNTAARARRREAERLKALRDQRMANSTDASSTDEVQASVPNSDTDTPAVKPTPRSVQEAYAQRMRDARKQNRADQSAAEQTTGSAEPLNDATGTDPAHGMDDEERQYIEDQRRGFKVINKRKRSRDELLNTPLDVLIAGIDLEALKRVEAMSAGTNGISAEAKTDLDNAPTEAIPVADVDAPSSDSQPASKVAESTPETAPVASKSSERPIEKVNLNPNNDPAIEHGLAKLETLREEMARVTANRNNRLFSLNGKKSKEIANTYNEQLITLGQLVTSDKLRGNTLTDSEKNVAVIKFLMNEQATLQEATSDKLQGTKASKFVEWMNIHSVAIDKTVDVHKVMSAVEKAKTDDDKVRFAQEHMANMYKKQVRGERSERGKEVARIAAIGVVGMAATAFGINPNTPVDAANNIFYGARKK